MALPRSIFTCSWLLQTWSSLHFAVTVCKASHLAEFNLNSLAVKKAVTSFRHAIQAGQRNQVPSIIPPTLNVNKINQINTEMQVLDHWSFHQAALLCFTTSWDELVPVSQKVPAHCTRGGQEQSSFPQRTISDFISRCCCMAVPCFIPNPGTASLRLA